MKAEFSKSGHRIWKSLPVVFFFTLLMTGVLNYNRIVRLYYAVTLFRPEKIAENFRSMGELFDSRTIHKGKQTSLLKEDFKKLPENYKYGREERNLRDFLIRTGTTGMIVLKDDTILYEEYFQGNNRHSRAISWSMSKSFVSALLGIAIREGYVKNIEQKVTDYVPELKGSGYDGVSIKNVLQMSSGVHFNEDYSDFHSDINRMGRSFALNTPLVEIVSSLKSERPAGTYNHYVSTDTQTLGMILREATGQTLTHYAEEKLWVPMGMESDGQWLIDSSGMEAAFGGLCVTLRDYARFGRLYLNKGNWNGKQLVPATWVQNSITPDAPHLMPGKRETSNWVLGYGYQWWIPEIPDGEFMALGIYGQAIYVYPRYKIVIVRTSTYKDYYKDGHDMVLESIEVYRTIARTMSQSQ